MNESRTGRHQIADRCIAQNHINTEMNESRTGKQQQIQIDSSRFSQTTANSDSSSRFRQTIPDAERGKTRRMQSQ
ncbi:hypothetical protein Tco_1239078, partial [Tanacetum coccineum]